MKRVIGGEISREEPRVIDLTKSTHVLDLRKPLPKAGHRPEPRPAPQPAPPPPELPLEPPPAPQAPQDETRIGGAAGDSAEQAGVDGRDGAGGEKDHVRPREAEAPAAPTAAPPAKKRRRFRLPRWPLRKILIEAAKAAVLVAAAVFFLSLGVDLPERLIGIYFVASVVYSIDSQRTFLVALIFLVMVAVWSAFGQNVPAENYAIYAFYFLVIGLVSALRELVVHKPKSRAKNPEN
jgi:hypothetical protein